MCARLSHGLGVGRLLRLAAGPVSGPDALRKYWLFFLYCCCLGMKDSSHFLSEMSGSCDHV